MELLDAAKVASQLAEDKRERADELVNGESDDLYTRETAIKLADIYVEDAQVLENAAELLGLAGEDLGYLE